METSNGESKIRKVLFNEISLLLSIMGVFIAGFLYVTQPTNALDKNIALIQKDISVINSNHLTHLQNYAEEIKNMKQQDAELAEELEEISLILMQIKTELRIK